MQITHSRELYADRSDLNESRDCVVRATSVAGCMSYADAHKLLFDHGRKFRRGTPIAVTMAALKDEFGASVCHANRTPLSRFVAEHPEGHYVLLTCNHALALVDGKVYDWEPHPRCLIRWYFKLA